LYGFTIKKIIQEADGTDLLAYWMLIAMPAMSYEQFGTEFCELPYTERVKSEYASLHL
jgi:hypothetical protein